MANVGCKTMRMGDVLPETRGTPLGDVVLGKENEDFFVIGENEDDPEASEADSGKKVVVFKTRERHPSWKVARVAGAPVRVLKTTIHTVIDKIGDLLTFWKPKKEETLNRAGPLATPSPGAAPQTDQTGG